MPHLLKRIPIYIGIAINLIVIAAMLVCAYSMILPPQTYPNWSWLGMVFPLPLLLNAIFIIFWLFAKWRVVAVPILGMVLCAGPIRTFCPINLSREVPEGCIKVLSYNVYDFAKMRTGTEWEECDILRYIIDADADIVCLQECVAPRLEHALDLCRATYPYIEQHEYSGNILLLLSKHEVVSSQRINYTSGSNFSYAYDVRIGGDTVMVINSHFESYKLKEADREAYKKIIRNPKHEDTENNYTSLVGKLAASNAVRGPQADSVAVFIERNAHRPIIACGDFNCPPLSYTHHSLTRYLNDAYTRSGFGPGFSYNRSGMYFRIDNILCSSHFTPYSATVDKSISTSDHYPIFTFLHLEP